MGHNHSPNRPPPAAAGELNVGRYESGNHREMGEAEDLARQAIGLRFFVRLVHLDNVFWEPGGFDKERKTDDVSFLFSKPRADSWIVEGVFGELAEIP